MMNKTVLFKRILTIFVFLLCSVPLFSQDLALTINDFRIEQLTEDGFHLYIRKRPDISSVLLVESTRDPAMGADNFAYRAAEWNPINGNEIRLLDGFPLRDIYSLVSSTPVPHAELGEAFHIYIPWIVYYGYEGMRQGEVYVGDGTYFNIRAFEFPYADYRGRFMDNPFILHVAQRIPERPEGNYSAEAERAFQDIADVSGGDFVYASSPDEMMEIIRNVLAAETGKSVDIVICLDTTASMRPYINSVRAELITMLLELIPQYTEFRLGLVLYKDYYDVYLTRVFPFTRDLGAFQRNLNAAEASGGGDIPEAVYEALYDGAVQFPWAAESRIMILAGDAPPHPRPRGRITGEMAFNAIEDRDIRVTAILLPH